MDVLCEQFSDHVFIFSLSLISFRIFLKADFCSSGFCALFVIHRASEDGYVPRTPAHLSMAATLESASEDEGQSRPESSGVWFEDDTDIDDGNSDCTERG